MYNDGNAATGALSVALSPTASFSLSAPSIPGIAQGESVTFTVAPISGLVVGTHIATVTVSGADITPQTFTVAFEVKAIPTFTVTFTSASGTSVSPQTVERGGRVTAPTTMPATRPWVLTAGLWQMPLPTEYTFGEWRYGNDAWDFATDTVTRRGTSQQTP